MDSLRWVVPAVLAGLVLGVAAGAAPSPAAPAAPATPPVAAPAAPPAKTDAPPAAALVEARECEYEVYVGKDKVGQMQLKTLAISGVVILDEDFQTSIKGKELSFVSHQVYREESGKPVPQSARASTRAGGLKQMAGTLTFAMTAAAPSVKMSAEGFVDKDGQPLEKAATEVRSIPVPAGQVLSHAAMMYFGPRLLPAAGQQEKIIYMDLPDGPTFPSLVALRGGCTLVRTAVNKDGDSQISIKQVFPGGNEEVLVTMTVDRVGRVTELRLAKFTLKLHKGDGLGRGDILAPPPPSKAPPLPPPPPVEQGAGKSEK